MSSFVINFILCCLVSDRLHMWGIRIRIIADGPDDVLFAALSFTTKIVIVIHVHGLTQHQIHPFTVSYTTDSGNR